ncbi:hypothetical protein [Natronosalvus vescus]|uniref:hypothetical protein n=1 Tax=Natronosalvus vescus TaxID=2953881 RepID=UPI0020906C3B|nr:hypothetical protein [Natronosalvus vescus]
MDLFLVLIGCSLIVVGLALLVGTRTLLERLAVTETGMDALIYGGVLGGALSLTIGVVVVLIGLLW